MMGKSHKFIGMAVIILGIVAVVLGAIFIYQGISKNNLIVNRMKVEKVTLSLDPNNPDQTTSILTGDEAQTAADVIASHRRAIAPSYQDLLGGGRFDPTDTQQLTYAQAMNLENYLYLAVAAFGLVQVVLGTGVFMVVTGFALGLLGYTVMQWPAKTD